MGFKGCWRALLSGSQTIPPHLARLGDTCGNIACIFRLGVKLLLQLLPMRNGDFVLAFFKCRRAGQIKRFAIVRIELQRLQNQLARPAGKSAVFLRQNFSQIS